jgi:uncharacterized protein with von Willebrand factor type A (vWA) domain
MRIIALKLTKETTLLLRDIARNHAKRDIGFVEDLYSLIRLKGAGIPTKSRIQKLCANAAKKASVSPMLLGFLANKRALLFQSIIKIPYFAAMYKVKNPFNALERFLTYFTKLHNKIRQAQCLTCPLMSQCQFGQQYGSSFVDITYVVDPDFALKVHDDCPELPQIQIVNQMAVATKQMEDMIAQMSSGQSQLAQMPPELEEVKKETEALDKEIEPEADDDLFENLDEEDFDLEEPRAPRQASKTLGGDDMGASVGDFYGHITHPTEKVIDQLSIQNLNIFELGKKFSLALGQTKKNKFKPTAKLDRKQREKQMQSVSDISKIVPAQHGLPEEMFEAKADKKQLKVKENLEEEKERQLLYILIDNSISMDGQFPGAANTMFSRGTVASVFGIALCRHVLSEGGIVFLRFFATTTTPLREAEKMEDFKTLETILAKAAYNGSGTRILRALSSAAQDIAEGKNRGLKIAKAEVLLITDGEDHTLTIDNIKAVMKDVEFNVLDVAGKGAGDSPAIKATATKYYKVDETEPDITKMVSVV